MSCIEEFVCCILQSQGVLLFPLCFNKTHNLHSFILVDDEMRHQSMKEAIILLTMQ
jgi:hypothetical protein